MSTYMSGSHPRYTVKTLLKEAERSPRPRQAKTSGQHCDHVVELQIIAAALNDMLPIVFWQEPLQDLLSHFDSDENVKEIGDGQNREKGAAVRRLIQRQAAEPEDAVYIQAVREKWKTLKEALKDYDGFKLKMDKLIESA